MESQNALLALLCILCIWLISIICSCVSRQFFPNTKGNQFIGKCYFSTLTDSDAGIVYLKIRDVTYGLCHCETIESEREEYEFGGIIYTKHLFDTVTLPLHHFDTPKTSKWVEIPVQEYDLYKQGVEKMNDIIENSR